MNAQNLLDGLLNVIGPVAMLAALGWLLVFLFEQRPRRQKLEIEGTHADNLMKIRELAKGNPDRERKAEDRIQKFFDDIADNLPTEKPGDTPPLAMFADLLCLYINQTMEVGSLHGMHVLQMEGLGFPKEHTKFWGSVRDYKLLQYRALLLVLEFYAPDHEYLLPLTQIAPPIPENWEFANQWNEILRVKEKEGLRAAVAKAAKELPKLGGKGGIRDVAGPT
ncbi:MAG: hypothetical protein K8T20_13880 [Planctomycetes bacterium]|nr:hypothetical protein [Planctomycetota bacterium]